jgi:hypothetical protein
MVYNLDQFKDLIQKAKLEKSISKLEQIHMRILEALQYTQDFKKGNRRFETYHLNDDLHTLEDLNCLCFQTLAIIEKNRSFRLKKSKK